MGCRAVSSGFVHWSGERSLMGTVVHTNLLIEPFPSGFTCRSRGAVSRQLCMQLMKNIIWRILSVGLQCLPPPLYVRHRNSTSNCMGRGRRYVEVEIESEGEGGRHCNPTERMRQIIFFMSCMHNCLLTAPRDRHVKPDGNGSINKLVCTTVPIKLRSPDQCTKPELTALQPIRNLTPHPTHQPQPPPPLTLEKFSM
jgi:hypothetical protein